MASKAADSDADSMTPSEDSEGEERSEHDSDYGSEQEEDEEDENAESGDEQKDLNIQWTGYGKKVPVLLFSAEILFNKKNTSNRSIGERYHLAFKFGNTECKVVRSILSTHGFHEVHPNSPDFNLLWTNSHLKPFTLRCLTEFQKVNHFPGSYELTRKDRLYKNIQKMQQIKGAKYFDFVPTSFVLPGEYQDFCSAFLKDKGPWIVKPVASSRGRGVFLINHPDQVPLEENIIVSKYIPNPVLIDGFKFDVRLYVAVTSYDPLLIYLYEEGLTRFATVRYEKSNRQLRNQCMHLTNYSVNKKSQDYVKNDDPNIEDYGNKWSMGAVLRYLKSQGRDTTAMMMRIEDVVIKTILSVELAIATACKMFMPYRGNCFELYGFDVLIDENLKPWILEVNLSPSLACDSPLDLKIKAYMLCDLFSLVGFVCHDPMMRTTQPNRRTQELAAKVGSRAKGNADSKGTKDDRQRPQSAGSSSREKQGNRNLQGLNSEEIKILRRVKEEDLRSAGWIRIFPSLDSWDVYSPFLQFNTTYNLLLHQRLYPERHKGVVANSKGSSTTVTSVGSRSKQTYVQITSSSGCRIDQERALESYAQALCRVRQYERRLGARKQKKKKPLDQKKTVKLIVREKVKLVQVAPEDEDTASQSSELGKQEVEKSEEIEKVEVQVVVKVEPKGVVEDLTKLIAPVKQLKRTLVQLPSARFKEVKDVTETENSQTVVAPAKGPEKSTTQTESPPSHTVEVGNQTDLLMENPLISLTSTPTEPVIKYNVVEMLQKGALLCQEQARLAFAMYLVRVQQRLLIDNSQLTQEGIEAVNEQMDLVLRFLRRAAVNLSQAFRVVVPSRKLPLLDRRRILAKQLGDFVHIYNKETEQLKLRKQAVEKKLSKINLNHGPEELDEKKFEQFVHHASETELEEVLTTYTKLNKSASIFLGGSNFPRGVEENLNKSNAHSSPPVNSSNSTPYTTLPSNPLSKRRSSFENPEAQKTAVAEDVASKSRSTAIPSIPDTAACSRGPVATTGPSVTVSTCPSSTSLVNTFANAVSIYTQRLIRPRSACMGLQKTASNLSHLAASRPISAVSKPMNLSSFTTMQPTVDTYNEKAIHDALQRLTQKQQSRQYSAINTNPLLNDPIINLPGSAAIPAIIPATASSNRIITKENAIEPTTQSCNLQSVLPSGMVLVNSDNSVPAHLASNYIPVEDNESMKLLPKPKPLLPAARSFLSSTTPHIQEAVVNGAIASRNASSLIKTHSHHPRPSSISLDNASVTCNSFVNDANYPWHGDLVQAYSQVTGVSPQNYHRASVGSRQLAIAQEQALRKQKLLEQSHTMLQQSKAKHQAMVAQAHSAQRLHGLSSSSHSINYGSSTDLRSSSSNFPPKPPIPPAAGKRSASNHRLPRQPTITEWPFNNPK